MDAVIETDVCTPDCAGAALTLPASAGALTGLVPPDALWADPAPGPDWCSLTHPELTVLPDGAH